MKIPTLAEVTNTGPYSIACIEYNYATFCASIPPKLKDKVQTLLNNNNALVLLKRYLYEEGEGAIVDDVTFLLNILENEDFKYLFRKFTPTGRLAVRILEKTLWKMSNVFRIKHEALISPQYLKVHMIIEMNTLLGEWFKQEKELWEKNPDLYNPRFIPLEKQWTKESIPEMENEDSSGGIKNPRNKGAMQKVLKKDQSFFMTPFGIFYKDGTLLVDVLEKEVPVKIEEFRGKKIEIRGHTYFNIWYYDGHRKIEYALDNHGDDVIWKGLLENTRYRIQKINHSDQENMCTCVAEKIVGFDSLDEELDGEVLHVKYHERYYSIGDDGMPIVGEKLKNNRVKVRGNIFD